MIRRVLVALLRPRTAAETIVCNELVHELNLLSEAQRAQINVLEEQLWLWRQMARDLAVLASDYAAAEKPNEVVEERLHLIAARIQDRVAAAGEFAP